MSTTRHTILGFPNSGKTTYLAALWHVIDAGTTNTSLKLKKITGDTTYLNKIMQTWIKCQQVPRTLMSSEEMVEMFVRNTVTHEAIVLSLPDFSGETFQAIYADRECEEHFTRGFEGDGGILFFINADRPNDMMSVLDHVFENDFEAGDANNEHQAEPDPIEDFDPRKVPEQTRIVDFLQILQDKPFYSQRRRLVLAISAWDVVENDSISPSDWVAREMPLLAQFLENNTQDFNVRYCGISAQGGEFTEETRTDLLKLDPSKRVVCEWDGSTSTDITQPLTWLGSDDT